MSSQLLISEKGKTPTTIFNDGEKYRVVDKFLYSTVGNDFMKFSPSISDIRDFAIRIDEKKLLYANSNEEYLRYLEIVKCVKDNADHQQLLKYYVSLARKLASYGNDYAGIIRHFKRYIDTDFSNEIIEIASEKNHVIKPKCVVFNDEYLITDYHKNVISNREIGKQNSKLIVKTCKEFPSKSVEDVASSLDLSTRTVFRVLKKNPIMKPPSKKMRTAESVKLYRKDNPKATQKECSIFLGKSERTVRTYWNSK